AESDIREGYDDLDPEIGKGEACPFDVDARDGEIGITSLAGLTVHAEREASVRRTLCAGSLERRCGNEHQRDRIIEIDRHRLDAPPRPKRRAIRPFGSSPVRQGHPYRTAAARPL